MDIALIILFVIGVIALISSTIDKMRRSADIECRLSAVENATNPYANRARTPDEQRELREQAEERGLIVDKEAEYQAAIQASKEAIRDYLKSREDER